MRVFLPSLSPKSASSAVYEMPIEVSSARGIGLSLSNMSFWSSSACWWVSWRSRLGRMICAHSTTSSATPSRVRPKLLFCQMSLAPKIFGSTSRCSASVTWSAYTLSSSFRPRFEQALVDFGAEQFVGQRALDQLVVAAQGLMRQQARDQDLCIVIHLGSGCRFRDFSERVAIDMAATCGSFSLTMSSRRRRTRSAGAPVRAVRALQAGFGGVAQQRQQRGAVRGDRKAGRQQRVLDRHRFGPLRRTREVARLAKSARRVSQSSSSACIAGVVVDGQRRILAARQAGRAGAACALGQQFGFGHVDHLGRRDEQRHHRAVDRALGQAGQVVVRQQPAS